MPWLSRTSLRHRLTLLVGGTTALTLVTSFIAFSLFERGSIRQGLVRNLRTQAQVLSPMAVADLDFGSLMDSNRSLAALSANRHILAARLFDAAGNLVASTAPKKGGPPLPDRAPRTESYAFHDHVLDLVVQLREEERVRGTLFIRSDLAQIDEQFRATLRIFGGAGLVLLLLVILLGYVLQRQVTAPILALAEGAGRVSLGGDFSLRFPEVQGGEIGVLSRAFNEMLGQIQEGDRRLHAYQDHLEEQVVRRSEMLQRTQLLLSATLDALPAFIAILDSHGTVLDVNRKWEDFRDPGNPLVGGVLVGSDYRAACSAPPASAASLQAAGRGLLEFLSREDEAWRMDYEFLGAQGPRWFRIMATRFQAGEGSHLVVMHVDESDQRRMEIQLRQAQKLESIGQLAAGIAHEINTPIQYIGDNATFLRRSFEELLGLLATLEADRAKEDEPDGEDIPYLRAEIPKAIDQTLEGVGRVSRIVNAMKEFSHPGTEDMTRTDLNRAIENTALVCRSEWKYVADLRLELDPLLPSIPCHPGPINQVILNLIINASHAVAENLRPGSKGWIRIATRPTEDGVEILVEDSGKGVPPEIRPRIFDPFFTTKPVGKGTGQGLAMVYSTVVRQHNGTITVSGAPGQGAVFTVRLPGGREPAAPGVDGSGDPG
jgi:signal transduction histidine kinase/HAMP domain-containing protein